MFDGIIQEIEMWAFWGHSVWLFTSKKRYTLLWVGSTGFQKFALGWTFYNRRYFAREGNNRQKQQDFSVLVGWVRSILNWPVVVQLHGILIVSHKIHIDCLLRLILDIVVFIYRNWIKQKFSWIGPKVFNLWWAGSLGWLVGLGLVGCWRMDPWTTLSSIM